MRGFLDTLQFIKVAASGIDRVNIPQRMSTNNYCRYSAAR